MTRDLQTAIGKKQIIELMRTPLDEDIAITPEVLVTHFPEKARHVLEGGWKAISWVSGDGTRHPNANLAGQSK